MSRTLLGAVCVVLLSAGARAGQTPAPAQLSPELRAQVANGRFSIVTSVRGLPLGVRDALQELFGARTLDIAEPGADYQRTDVVVDAQLPTRRMVAAGCQQNRCIVYYERGGFAHTWHVAMFHWTPDATQFEFGGAAPGGLKSIDDVRNAILSGAITADRAQF